MKATGIVRRIDDLGRIVIPKEIRRSLGIEVGEPLEIFVDDEKVIFQKYKNEIDKAKNARAYLKMQNFGKASNAKFEIEDRNITCTLYGIDTLTRQIKKLVGTAICAPEDDFNADIGMFIAYCRACNFTEEYIEEILNNFDD